ncbi:MAG TPA: metalloprotease TldD [Pseudomonadales bacterium]|nr:metalloprotease TldD [Pseudomonadales bacterium]
MPKASAASHLEQVSAQILQPAGLQLNDLETALASIHQHDIDYADLYFQRYRSEAWELEDGIVKGGSFNAGGGVGVRAISGEKTGFAISDDMRLPALLRSTQAARSIAKLGQSQRAVLQANSGYNILYSADNPIPALSEQQKVELLKSTDAFARSLDQRIIQVSVSLAASHQWILIAATDGTLAADIRPMVRMNVSVIAEQNGRRERGSCGGGGRYSLDYFLQDERTQQYAREAVRQALINLEAVPAPAGVMPVVLGNGWPGVLLHEAVGHGLEGDFNRKGASLFANRMGEQVASPVCTVVDDGTIVDRRGSLSIDDEGTPSQCTTLIENGKLTNYLQDKLNARLMKRAPTGNGRRESYAHITMPRMTNTYLLPGQSEPEEIIRSVKKGIYAANFGGGQVDITSGKFVFSASEAYLIEDGKITAPIKGATLIGNGPEVMQRISMLGNDLKLDLGVGNCGKEGQSVPVGVGQPTLKIDELTVGGTA